MRVVALISGGKDSCFNMMQCVAAGHEIVALANLEPPAEDEMDSYMYQTVGHDGISLYSEAMGLPLFRRKIQGTAVVQKKEYSPVDGDEVEDLHCLLSDIKAELEFDAVAVGAILSDYQRIRVENVCTRLGCISLAYLWRRDQTELLQEMIDCGINAIIIKTASLGLDPDVHLGQSIAEMKSHLNKSKKKYGINVCGEGGEYETFTLDCPLFSQAIVLDEFEKVIHSNDAFAPVGYLKLTKLHLVRKTAMRKVTSGIEESAALSEESSIVLKPISQKKRMLGFPVKCPLDHLSDLIECHKADCCDGHVELCNQNHGPRDTDDDEEYSEKSNCNNHDNHSRTLSDPNRVDPIPLVSPQKEDSPLDVEDPNSAGLDTPEKDSSEGTLEENLVARTELEPLVGGQSERLRETISFPVSRRITSNAAGWFWVMGIHDSEILRTAKSSKRREEIPVANKPAREIMKNCLDSLQSALEEHNLQVSDLVSIVMYVSDMSDYSEYNAEYLAAFSTNPPVRVCVEAPLPFELPVQIEALAFRNSNIDAEYNRKCMHVQGISHWAPANIGPYSQAVWVGDIIYIAGQIGLVPGSMKLVEGGARIECKLALRHISRVIKAVDPKVEMRDVVQGVCYVTDASFIEECRREWEKRTNNAIVEYLVVPRLPRNANVEWQVWAHKHNTAFEYEETGCYIGADVKVRLIRRWNYECRVAVIVCTALCARFGRSEMIEMTEYALNKLNHKSDDKSQECAIRVYYRLGAVNPSDIEEVMGNQSAKHNVAFSIIPVCLLVKETAVISFCGVRHQ